MNDKQNLIEAEQIIDQLFNKLEIWQLPFQSVASLLLLTIENIDYKGNTDTAMDFASRLSYIMPIIKSQAAKSSLDSSTNAILSGAEHFKDINFITGYAHFSMLMPQVHRNVFNIRQSGPKSFNLEYIDEATEYAEKIDRLYSYLSLEFAMDFRYKESLSEYLKYKVVSNDWALYDEDIQWLSALFQHYQQYNSLIRPLPDDIFTVVLGYSYQDYIAFCSSVRAFADFFVLYGRAFYIAATSQGQTQENADKLTSEYFEYVVDCIRHEGFVPFIQVSGLSSEVFYRVFFYFLWIYSDTSGNNLQERAFCGDGFAPPFISIEDCIMFSPHMAKYMLTVNNVLYSVNKKNKKAFDQQVSGYLEPTLLNQLVYIFSAIPGIECRRNITYGGGEIDLLILSSRENFCLCIQAKATIAPDSGRTVHRVEGRSIEGIEQIFRFNELTESSKLALINHCFDKKITQLRVHSLLVVRSCAGSGKAWQKSHLFDIVNYVFLASIIADKLEGGHMDIADLHEKIMVGQDALIKETRTKIVRENLVIGEYSIQFPNVYTDLGYLFSRRIKCLKYLPDFENIT